MCRAKIPICGRCVLRVRHREWDRGDLAPHFLSKVFTKKLNRLNCWSTLTSNVTVGTGFRRAFIKQRFRATSCG